MLGAGLAVLAAGMVAVRHGTVSPLERDLFRAVNGLPDALYPAAWPVLQLGAVLVGPLVAVAAIATGRRRLAVAAIVATILKLGAERIVKVLVSRPRPGTSIGPDIHARGDVHLTGESFVSGHAALVAALAVVATPYLPAALARGAVDPRRRCRRRAGLRRRPQPARRRVRRRPRSRSSASPPTP